MQTINPTPYADVNQVLRDFLTPIQAILGNQFVGMYLYGSLALGDFNPQGSDIDFIVVTETEITDDQLAALRDLHARFKASGSRWAKKIEAAYLPREALNHPFATSAAYPQIETITDLVKAPLEIGWPFQRWTLRERGVIVAGREPKTMIDPVDPNDMRRSIAAITEEWLEQARDDPEWLEWVRARAMQSFVVLTLCRSLYALDQKSVTSKPSAARWAQASLGKPWSGLIEQAVEDQHGEGEVSQSQVDETIALIELVFKRSQRDVSES